MPGSPRSWAHLLVAAPLVLTVKGVAAQERTTAQYDDWVVECANQQGPPQQKSCAMAQVTQMKGRNTPFSRIAIENPVGGQPVRLSIQVPVNVLVRTDLMIKTGDADTGLAAPFDRCTPAGCFAEVALKPGEIQKLQSATADGTVTFRDSGGHDAVVPLSFKGFDKAFAALSKK